MKPVYLFWCLAIALLVFSSQAYAQQKKLSCEDLHIGKFKIVDSSHNAITYIERNDSTETEYVKKIGVTGPNDHTQTLLFKIEWADKCTYKLTLLKSWYHTTKGEYKLPVGNRVVVNKILNTGVKAYVIQTLVNNRSHANFLQRVEKVFD
jgi:hypothetical protein